MIRHQGWYVKGYQGKGNVPLGPKAALHLCGRYPGPNLVGMSVLYLEFEHDGTKFADYLIRDLEPRGYSMTGRLTQDRSLGNDNTGLQLQVPLNIPIGALQTRTPGHNVSSPCISYVFPSTVPTASAETLKRHAENQTWVSVGISPQNKIEDISFLSGRPG